MNIEQTNTPFDAPSARKARVLDLFAGCGGFSLGFAAAGFDIMAGIELDPKAFKTHEANFPSDCISTPQNIEDLQPSDVLSNMPEGKGPDVIIGGPPCQPFTRIGRAKLRAIAGDIAAHVHDKRVTLYEHYLRFVDELAPHAFVIENVPDMGRFNGRNIAEEIALTAEDLGYEVRYTLLNSAWYGVPQFRERVIIIGIQKSLNQLPLFPEKTHTVEIPIGYMSSRFKDESPFLDPTNHYAGEPNEVLGAHDAITSSQAISDLPELQEHLVHMKARTGARRFNKKIRYKTIPESTYQRLMRYWEPPVPNGIPSDHVIRYTPRDYETFKRMTPGDQYPQAILYAQERLEEALANEEGETGIRHLPNSHRYQELQKAIVPPYDYSKFPNKWQKIDPESPAHTLPAHLGKDSYSHIHYDSEQARMISVREAARLQSFPDHFHFSEAMNNAFKQIGNSVPPLMAYAIASSLRKQLVAGGVLPETHVSDVRESQPEFFERQAYE